MNEFAGEDARVQALFEDCTHHFVDIVCLECGLAMPAPNPGYEWDGEGLA